MIYKLWFPWRSDGTEKGSKYTRKEGRKERWTDCYGRLCWQSSKEVCLFYDTVFPSDVKEQHSKGQVTGRQHADFLMFIPENLLSC